MRSVEQSDERDGICERVAVLAATDRGTRGPLSSPHRSMLTVPGSMPMTRGMTGAYIRVRATSRIDSASSTRSFRSNSFAMHAL